MSYTLMGVDTLKREGTLKREKELLGQYPRAVAIRRVSLKLE